MKENGGFDRLWKNKQFMSQIISIIWDKAHCVSKWGDFHPEYKFAGHLWYLIPASISYFTTSATLPPAVLDDISDIMRLRKKMFTIHRSNDRSNVYLVVREFQYPMSSYLDLAFLVPDNTEPDWKPPKFLVFFDDISESVAAAKFLKSHLPPHLWNTLKIVWFNAEMTPEFREEQTESLKEGIVYGLCCTDSFGMVGSYSSSEICI